MPLIHVILRPDTADVGLPSAFGWLPVATCILRLLVTKWYCQQSTFVGHDFRSTEILSFSWSYYGWSANKVWGKVWEEEEMAVNPL